MENVKVTMISPNNDQIIGTHGTKKLSVILLITMRIILQSQASICFMKGFVHAAMVAEAMLKIRSLSNSDLLLAEEG
jgi:hypothetical protein